PTRNGRTSRFPWNTRLIRNVRAALEARIDHRLDVGGIHDPAGLIDESHRKLLPGRFRAQRIGTGPFREPSIAPRRHRDKGQAERAAHPGEGIFYARALSVLAIFALFHDAGV